MKKTLKSILIIFCIISIIVIGLLFYSICATAPYKLDENKLVNLKQTITFYDKDNNKISEMFGGNEVTSISNINKNTINAFVAIEDRRFYSHNGIDFKRLLSATFNNIKSLSFKEGGSTISQQLIKNTHLSSKKTINRKLIEIKLARDLEKKFTKNEILEKYLNTIYFGENCYGITNAAKHYFNKQVNDLSLNESAMLAAIIKAPTNYSPFDAQDKCFKRKNLVLKTMLDQGYIDTNDYSININKMPKLYYDNQTENDDFDYIYFAKKDLKKINQSAPYDMSNLDVYLNIDKNAQAILTNAVKNIDSNLLKSAILLDKNNKICAYYSNCGNMKRQLGSVIKPIIAYAPAIEKDLIYPYSHIVDEKIDFNGYSPSNYNNVYHGKVTIKESLEKSLNVCAVKILNCVGVENAKLFAKKVGLSFSEKDKSLCIALGCTEHGDTLSNITSAYSVFLNKGIYHQPTCINRIAQKNNIVRSNIAHKNKVFSYETVSFMNEMLRSTVMNGTAKKLSFLPFPVYAKTGTVGNANGNTDAYVISYNSEYILGCWVGNKDGKLMDNSTTGGTTPSIMAYDIWSSLYKNKTPPKVIENSNNLITVSIDKISYEKDDIILLSDKYAPEKYNEKILIKKSNLPKEHSKRFSEPKIEKPKLSINNNVISLQLCVTELYGVEIYRSANNGEKKLIVDIFNKPNYEYIDNEISPNTSYEYSVIPYYKTLENKKIYGIEIFLDKIKSPNIMPGDNWWTDDC